MQISQSNYVSVLDNNILTLVCKYAVVEAISYIYTFKSPHSTEIKQADSLQSTVQWALISLRLSDLQYKALDCGSPSTARAPLRA